MVLAEIGLYIWGLFKLWLTALFVSPFNNLDMLWLLIPIWATWFFAEFFQEKMGTSMGNAITNAVVVLWGSIDCSRQTVLLMGAGAITGIGNIASRFILVGILFAYGVTIVTLGLKGFRIIKYIGRIREVTYAFAIFTPIFYNAMSLNLNHIIAALLFFPLFYFIIEVIDRYTPNPKAVAQDIKDKLGDSSSDDLSSGNIGSDDFGKSKSFGSSNDLGGLPDSGSTSNLNSALGKSGKSDSKSDDEFGGDFKL